MADKVVENKYTINVMLLPRTLCSLCELSFKRARWNWSSRKDQSYEHSVKYYEYYHEVQKKASRRAQGQVIRDAVLSSAGAKRSKSSLTSSPDEKIERAT
ncbi:hypothetical protein TSAR_002085 [Trichomalopsis sarcophagae]|uniref:Uncharacterized protein n=1 Tax=Trichomalopsis sarcophagae TaxID=543379 RepID=A0A232FED0_9HYME|nr:hypothetical protein TSAR_002085 [Trichomalopsis sarcophagae]